MESPDPPVVRCPLCNEWILLGHEKVMRYTSRDEGQINTFYIGKRTDDRHMNVYGRKDIVIPLDNFERILTFRING